MNVVTKPNARIILRDYINEHGLKQTYVARKMGLSDQQLSNLINGSAKFTGDKAIMVSKALGVPLDIFLDKNYT